ncbi:hypothetical protein DINM_022497 [Dirofilaria immitis]|nr:hypothetical protein [Dirofilaria immitis]
MIAAIQDQTSIPENMNFHHFFMTFSWGTITLIGYYIMYFQGSIIFPLLLDFIIDTSSAILLAYIIIPAVVYFNLSKYEEYSRESRFVLLIAALFQGLLVGFLLSNCSTIIILPVEAINMLFISIISRILGHKLNNDRQAYFGIINGIGFIFLITIGYVTRYLTKAYFFASILTVFTSHTIIQIYMRRVMQHRRHQLIKRYYVCSKTITTTEVYNNIFEVDNGNNNNENNNNNNRLRQMSDF